MARTLRAKPPDTGTTTKPKVLIFGPPNVGKTWRAVEFPQSYFIDTEGGASLPQYQAKLKAAGGIYLGKEQGSQDFATVIDEIQGLATQKHNYLTLIIDSFSKLYLIAAALAEAKIGNAFGIDKKAANVPTRQLMLWLERLDMNVLLICHSKDKWERHGKELVSVGQTFDGWDKLEYDLHLCLQIGKDGMARVQKTRLEGFPRDAVFPWNFAEFEKRAGHDVMLRPRKPITLASKEEVFEVRRLLTVVKLAEPADEWEARVWNKAGCSSWEDMEREKLLACSNKLSAMVKPVSSATDNSEPAPAEGVT